jgi:hydrogenase expression/formation protein HypC
VCLAVPGQILARYERDETPMARVDVGGVCSEACLVYVPEAQVGDWVLVHLGMALQRLEEDAAREHLRLLADFAEASELGAPAAEGPFG